jgi:hypothetical protein
MKTINFEPVVHDEHHTRDHQQYSTGRNAISILVEDERTKSRNKTMPLEEMQRQQFFSPSYEEDMRYPP